VAAKDTSATIRRSEIFFAEKEQALRDDVHRLGELVGDLVKEQGGEALFDIVEAARRNAIAHREGDTSALPALQTLLGALSPRAARDFIRAFSTYFQMVNMAEKVHRIRRRREYLRDASTPQPFGFEDTLIKLKALGVGAHDIEALLGRASIEPVFTAHPTEATRRTLLRKQQRIARILMETLDPYMSPQEGRAALGRIRMEMTTGWQTEEHPGSRMTVGDEAEHVLFFLTDVIYRMIPPFYEELEQAFATVYPEQGARLKLPPIVHFGSWVGGDMDGNPSVTAKTIRQSLARQRSLILNLYYAECQRLSEQLSQSGSRVGVSDEIGARSALYARHFSKAAHATPARHREMPYRVFLRLIGARLQATFDDQAFPYESPEEFRADVEIIADSLRANKGAHAGLFAVTRLLRRIDTFGFHIATLDLRQNALVHRQVVGEGLRDPGWAERTSAERAQRIREALERRESPLGSLSSEARRTLAVFQAIAHCRRKYGPTAIGPYIVSMTHGADDVLSVLLLARWGDLAPKGTPVPLDVVPLFETVGDLENASATMRALLSDQIYREHIEQRGLEQMVMVGYSDSNKDGGFASASWTLRKAQEALVATMTDLGVELTLFHGRGGTISRGGGRVHEAIRAAPAGAVEGRFRLTEQGEVINARYGLRGLAMRSLEQMLSSVVWATAGPDDASFERERAHEIMDMIAATSQRAYKELVYDQPQFAAYFRLATPIDVIERLGIGSRPSSRTGTDSLQDMRAIPWVFAWTQTRLLLSGWYGVGAGLDAAVEAFGLPAVRALATSWPFFRGFIADVEQVLGKADIEIAQRYSELAGDLHATFFPIIRAEFERAVDAVLALREQTRLLEQDRTLRRAIRLRNPYVDPMSLLQVDLLKRWRSAGSKDDVVLEALLVSVNGITHGMQNTG